MADTDCLVCELIRATEKCADCGMPLCRSCLVSCEVCEKTLCPRHIKTTSRGRKMCKGCRSERRAAQKARAEEKQTKKEAPPPEPEAAKIDYDNEGVMSFASLQRDQGEETKEPRDLKEMDQNRPILRASRYQPPSRKALGAAFLFFGISMVIVLFSVPNLREIMWPFETGGAEYNENIQVVIKDTNALRDTSNISQLNMLSQLFLFVLTWSFFLAYLFGVARIMIPTLRKVLPRIRDKVRYRKDVEYF